MAVSGTHNGWRYDIANSRLDMYYRGTRIANLDACGLDIVSGALTVASGLTVTACGVTVSAGGASITGGLTAATGDLTVTAGDLVLGGKDIRSAGAFQLLNAAGTNIFLAASCAEPCSGLKGEVWAWQGDACAVAAAGSAFLMIVDDGCVA